MRTVVAVCVFFVIAPWYCTWTMCVHGWEKTFLPATMCGTQEPEDGGDAAEARQDRKELAVEPTGESQERWL